MNPNILGVVGPGFLNLVLTIYMFTVFFIVAARLNPNSTYQIKENVKESPNCGWPPCRQASFKIGLKKSVSVAIPTKPNLKDSSAASVLGLFLLKPSPENRANTRLNCCHSTCPRSRLGLNLDMKGLLTAFEFCCSLSLSLSLKA